MFQKGHPGYWKDKKFSKEHKRNISETKIGHKHSEETKEKISKAMKGQKRKGSKNANWKGGQYKDKAGRIYIFKPKHPFAKSDRHVRRSRLVMEKKLGRYLESCEVVHHINGIKSDDRPENLQLFPNGGSHVSFHHKVKRSIARQLPIISNN